MSNEIRKEPLRDFSVRDLMFDSLHEVVFAFSPDGQLLEWNRRLNQVTGYTDEELAAMHPVDFVCQGEQILVRETLEEILSTGRSVLETYARTKDGRRIPCELQGSVIRRNGRTVICGTGRDISKRRKQEDLLRRSEQRFRRLFEESQEGIALISSDGVFLDVNPAVCELNGYSRSELVGMETTKVYAYPEERETFYRMLMEKGHVRSMVIHLRRKDGEVIICQVSASALRDSDGNVEAFQTYSRDITQQRRALEALTESENKFRTLAEKSHIGIAMLQKGVYKYVNPAFAEIFGYDRYELVDESPEMLFHADDWPAVRHRLEKRFAGEMEKAHYEARVRTKAGEKRIVEIVGSRMVYQDTSTIIGTVQDITEERRAREALAESERKFRELAEQSIMGIVLIQDGRFRYVNPEMAEMFGYNLQELLDEKGPEDLVHPGDWPRVAQRIRRRLSGDAPAMRFQARGVRRNQDIIHVDVYGTRVTSRGRPAVLCYLLDVTDRRQLQREILHIQEEERRRMGQDLHDGVGSQLSGIHIMLGSLTRQARELCPEVAEHLEHIQARVAESSEDVRRISRGLSPVDLEHAGLTTALKRLAKNASTSDGPDCRCRVEYELSDAHEKMATHLYWIAQEAVTNARKYAGADTIEIHLNQEESHLILLVTDDGEGFEQSDAQHDGLGLRTMRYRAELLGGTLAIDSAAGEGTDVHCQLPFDGNDGLR